jgi:hypothetical protein
MKIHQHQPGVSVISATPIVPYESHGQMHASAYLPQLTGNIGIFKVKEKTSIKPLDGNECVRPDQHAATTQVGDIKNLSVIMIRHDIPLIIAMQPSGLQPPWNETATQQSKQRGIAFAEFLNPIFTIPDLRDGKGHIGMVA